MLKQYFSELTHALFLMQCPFNSAESKVSKDFHLFQEISFVERNILVAQAISFYEICLILFISIFPSLHSGLEE